MSLHALMFGWEFPPLHSGGLGIACQGLVSGLLHKNVRVTLVLPYGQASSDESLTIRTTAQDPLDVRGVPSALRAYDDHATYARRGGHWGAEEGSLYGPNLVAAVDRFTELSEIMTADVTPDVVHCHDWMTYEAGRRCARRSNVPLVAHVHATELDRTHFRPNHWIADRERSGLQAADRVIAVSGYTKNILTSHYDIPEHKIRVVHNGYDPARYPPTERLAALRGPGNDPIVLFLGRLTLQKNPLQVLEIALRVRRLRPDVRFVIAGDGPMLPTMLQRACDLGITDSVLFTGKVTDAEASALYRSADCFIMPSVSEPFGLVALEAAAHGVPVIVSKQSGVAEVLRHGFAVDFWDAEKSADCIVTILREKSLASQLRSEAPKIAQSLTWRTQASIVTSIYREVAHT